MPTFFSYGFLGLGGGLLLWIMWLVLGRVLALSLDRYFLNGAEDRRMGVLAINANEFILAARMWPLPRMGRFPLKIAMDDRHRLLLSTQGCVFTLGTVSQIWTEPIEPQYQFSPDASDAVSFTRLTSRLSWPTSPFRFRIFAVQLPRWHRHAYDRLAWKKISGATLEIVWRDEQNFYDKAGWTDNNTNQLVSVKLKRSP